MNRHDYTFCIQLYIFRYEMIPFIEKCLFILFPTNELQQVLLVPQTDLEKLKSMLRLNVKILFAETILELIPSEVHIPVENEELIKDEEVCQSNENNIIEPVENAQSVEISESYFESVDRGL